MPLPRCLLAVACLLALAGLAQAAEPAAAADGPIRDPAGVKGYAVHEWGVFTIHPDLEMANAALAAEWADCPRELYRTEPPNLRNLPWRGGVRKADRLFPLGCRNAAARAGREDEGAVSRWPAGDLVAGVGGGRRHQAQGPGGDRLAALFATQTGGT